MFLQKKITNIYEMKLPPGGKTLKKGTSILDNSQLGTRGKRNLQ